MSKLEKLHIRNFLGAFLRLVRLPNLLIILVAQFLIRIFVIGPKENWKLIIVDPSFLLLCLATLMIAGAGYIINDYYDIKIDIVNNPKRVMIGKIFTRRVALFAHFIINIIAVLIGLLVALKMHDWKIFVTVFISGFLMWYYSNSLKRLALWGNLTISFLTGISIYYLSFLSNNNLNLVVIYSVFAFMISLIREIIKDMEDMKGDALYGCKTLPIVWGIKNTKNFIYAISIVFIFVMGSLFIERYNNLLALYFGLAMFPIFIFLLVRLYTAKSENDYHNLSTLSKGIMLAGLASILLV
ncbi:MAG TPA: geranylgeranylglycerol-phosphate geranylgeranyltransferase [Cytophagaceae bacterium]|nr:geranylgeranylglycerol-phosphate geranylgeranyltransferase [Cytophagaceae bacterium]